ncbi:MAG: GDYXXLXY domain-containing protein [Patescibacteria group bacterium]
MTKQTKFILAIALQILIIFSIIVFKMAILVDGTEVLLKIEPVDPTDPFRGDYVTFQYNISNLDSHLFSNKQIKNGDDIYVILRQNKEYWTVQKIQEIKPTTENQIFIKGKVISGGLESQTEFFPKQHFNTFRIHIIYGIEEYFIPEGMGRGFSFLNKEAAAKVSIDENGNAVLKQIYVDGKLWP